MQEPYNEGVANHADLGSCAGGGDAAGEALTEALAGRLSSREIPVSGADLVYRKGRQYQPSRFRKRRANSARPENPCTSGTSSQENRETPQTPAAKWQAGGGRPRPHVPRARRRGVGAGGSTDERFEQGRVSAGGGSGGKRPRQGERDAGPHGPPTEAGSRAPGLDRVRPAPGCVLGRHPSEAGAV